MYWRRYVVRRTATYCEFPRAHTRVLPSDVSWRALSRGIENENVKVMDYSFRPSSDFTILRRPSFRMTLKWDKVDRVSLFCEQHVTKSLVLCVGQRPLVSATKPRNTTRPVINCSESKTQSTYILNYQVGSGCCNCQWMKRTALMFS